VPCTPASLHGLAELPPSLGGAGCEWGHGTGPCSCCRFPSRELGAAGISLPPGEKSARAKGKQGDSQQDGVAEHSGGQQFSSWRAFTDLAALRYAEASRFLLRVVHPASCPLRKTSKAPESRRPYGPGLPRSRHTGAAVSCGPAAEIPFAGSLSANAPCNNTDRMELFPPTRSSVELAAVLCKSIANQCCLRQKCGRWRLLVCCNNYCLLTSAIWPWETAGGAGVCSELSHEGSGAFWGLHLGTAAQAANSWQPVPSSVC